MVFPRLIMDTKKIEDNTRTIAELSRKAGITITGVTKATCGDPEVARAMLRGGATSIGESRIENIKRIKEAGIETSTMLLRTPMPSRVEEVVSWADMSLNSEISVLKGLSKAAVEQGKEHGIIIMVEMGEIREGVNPDDLPDILERALGSEGLNVLGLGMNLACLTGVVPTREKMRSFEELVGKMEERFGITFEMISGGNSANIPGLLRNELEPEGKTNNIRVGEGILLGLETVERTAIPGTHQDAFRVEAEIIEMKTKPSVPNGVVSQNAFGETPEYEDRGIMKRAVVALGRQDVIVEDLYPLEDGFEIVGSSSDHIILNVREVDRNVGDVIPFGMRYGALVHLNTSPYVSKVQL